MTLHKLWTFSLLLLQPLGVALVARCLLQASAVASACIAALSFFTVCDGWYFLRIISWVLWETSRDYFHDHADREGLFATSVLPGRVLVVDIDRNAHCNNARYLRECGFGRRDLWHRNGLWKVVKFAGSNLIVGAQTIRFRREMTLGQRYVLTSRVLCWDSRAFYIEHRFVTQTSNEEPFVNAIVMVKSTVLGKLTPTELVEMQPALHSTEEANRPMTEDFQQDAAQMKERHGKPCNQAIYETLHVLGLNSNYFCIHYGVQHFALMAAMSKATSQEARHSSERTFVLLVLPPLGVATLARYALDANATSAACMGVLSFFAFCDGWYFLRLMWWSLCEAVHNAIYSGEKRAQLFATSKLPGRVLVVDVDRNSHCNNARFLRECGFARRGLWHQNGIWRLLKLNGGNLVVGAQTVRFRREMTLGQRYTIESRVLCWDNRAFYVEHRFVTFSDSNESFINAIVLVKNTVLGKLSPAKLVEKLPALYPTEETSPAMPKDVLKWIESNDISSKALRK